MQKKRHTLKSAVIIPALNPEPGLLTFVQKLLASEISKVIIVNDGSDRAFERLFAQLRQLENCTVLEHRENRGKGSALKTAFSYFLRHCPDLDGAVTADADGQHTAEDICKIARRLPLEKDALILGVRDFQTSKVPVRSYLGNMLTSRLFQLLYGVYLPDTQTGLRGIPKKQLAWITQLPGDRYDFEINMLLEARKRKLKFLTVSIQTLYFNNNSASHYDTVKDSAQIFLRLLSGKARFLCVAASSTLVDILGFWLLNSVLFADLAQPVRLFLNTLIARAASSLYKWAFSYAEKFTISLVNYFKFSLFLMLASYVLVAMTSMLWKCNEVLSKLVVDLGLGFACLLWRIFGKCRSDALS